MITKKNELAALDIETFEIEEIADLDFAYASAEMPVDGSTACGVPILCSTMCDACAATTSCS
ncbi:hypothetical protein GCM10009555_046340 [Acrocarpospora macrocephala]|uniref:Uncharacterized protein n=1 Tax=Acrocarpospora macrocephala TaxID=150177 RepID=A0A5M3WRH6_9ACTN|nr:hypothetical protein [Acrocarpospora macrocephala]GES11977.1 hypothetical protein Amac_055740 [Acrocarpospora macrocephala]